MALYRIGDDMIQDVPSVTFADAGISERLGLQARLRDRIDIVAPGALVISEEFCKWEDANRRIDLLCVDPDGTLVIVELKVTQDGGHMELQALRYAAMIAPMTFDQAVDALSEYMKVRRRGGDAREILLQHLDSGEDARQKFGRDVRVVLVSADFSREITTTVLWLQDRDIDIRCIRIRLHQLDGETVADVQQVIPLPEAEQYQVRLREKAQQERAAARAGQEPAPSLEESWDQLRAVTTDAEYVAASDVAERVTAMGTTWFANKGSFAQQLSVNGRKYYFFGFRPSAPDKLEIWYRWFYNRPPFDDPAVRAELERRLEGIPGLAVPEEASNRMPKQPLALLVDAAARDQFCSTWQWAIDTARSYAPVVGTSGDVQHT